MNKYFLWFFIFGGILSLSTSAYSQENDPYFKARASYLFQDISFTNNAQGANFELSYNVPKKWAACGGFHYLNKFNDSAPGYNVGGTYWATPKTVLNFDVEFAPNQVVIPEQAYTFEISQTVWGKLVPSVAYRFADYSTANSHIIMPTLTWYFYPRFDWMTRYYLTFSQFNGESATDSSVMTRITYTPWDTVAIFMGYARANESFESGNPISPTTGFSANHVFFGGHWPVYRGFGMDVTFDYEHRNNGDTLLTYESGLSYRW